MFFFLMLLRFRSYLVALVADLREISHKLPWQGKTEGTTPSCGGGGYNSLDLQKSMKQGVWCSMTAPHFILPSTLCDNMQKITEMTTR